VDDLTVSIYDATKTFPREELYGLTSQLRRAASSTAANIVEGSARASQKDYLHFLQIARASLAETHYFIHLAARLGYLNDAGKERLTGQANQTFACLHGLMQCVEREAAPTTKTEGVMFQSEVSSSIGS
jgi:four helix bundle protein